MPDNSLMIEYYINWARIAKRAYNIGLNTRLPPTHYNVDKIFFCGMGGSGIAGIYLHYVLQATAGSPIFTGYATGFNLPAWIDRRTLVFPVSFSGNTSETILCMRRALARDARIILVSRDGKFEDIARERNLPFVRVPEAPAPRAGLPSLLYTLIGLLVNMNMLDPVKAGVEASIDLLEDVNEAKDLAESFATGIYKYAKNKPLIVVTGDSTYPVVLRAKNEFAENAKHPVYYGTLPESAHNDIEAWKTLKDPTLLLIMSGERIEDEMLRRLPKALGAKNVLSLQSRGQTLLERMIWSTWIIGLTSLYLAAYRGIDAFTIEAIREFKRMISDLF